MKRLLSLEVSIVGTLVILTCLGGYLLQCIRAEQSVVSNLMLNLTNVAPESKWWLTLELKGQPTLA